MAKLSFPFCQKSPLVAWGRALGRKNKERSAINFVARESKALLDILFQQAQIPEYQFRHH